MWSFSICIVIAISWNRQKEHDSIYKNSVDNFEMNM